MKEEQDLDQWRGWVDAKLEHMDTKQTDIDRRLEKIEQGLADLRVDFRASLERFTARFSVVSAIGVVVLGFVAQAIFKKLL